MSTMSQFFGGNAGAIKSIQSGYVQADMTAGTGEDSSFVDITINPVSTAKTVLDVFGSASFVTNSAGYIFNSTSTSNATAVLRPRLTSSTNLRISSRATNILCRWYVIEFN